MKQYHQLDNVTLINFKKIFVTIEKHLLNNLREFGLIHWSINYKNKDVKRLLTHHTIHAVCEEILNLNTKHKKVIIFRPIVKEDTAFEILDYTKNLDELNKQLTITVNSIRKLLPIQIIFFSSDKSFEQLVAKDGEKIELLFKIFGGMAPANMSFQKVKAFAKKHKLSFLSQEYFNLLRTKQLFF